ncbi:recombinase family protein [Vulcanisaeta sp. JCM 16159]|uniref:recombinase family protein n=1 Tax=Vulcanisaeta sp. JCM 16159 TaxID=1295371 RepID=UPI0006D21580|nr:recombinase family protein [Vulcanisaeta sp. JCM 16159]
MRLVGYVRVSLGSEAPENQKYAILEYCARHGHQLVGVFEDIGVSGASRPMERPGFAKAIELLKGNQADGLIVASLDRIARSLVEFFEVYRMFTDNNWQLISVREDWLNALNPQVKPIILAVLSWAAEMEREFIRERTREALARLRAEGKRIGRPPKWGLKSGPG